jgi:RimJ/RimL family protein N-acetyltransferase
MKKLQIGSDLSLRPCTLEDAIFTYELMKSQMEHYFDSIPEGWSEEKYWQGFKPAHITILEHGNNAVGFFDYEICNNELYFHNLQLIPVYQGKGIGRDVVSYVKKIAHDKNLHRVIGKVFKTNTKSYNLLQRSGFTVQKDLIEDNSYLLSCEV